MIKIILGIVILAITFNSSAQTGDNSIELNNKIEAPLCSISLYKEDVPLLVGSKFKLKNGQFLISDCSDARISFEWWELSRQFASDFNSGNDSYPPSIPPSTKK